MVDQLRDRGRLIVIAEEKIAPRIRIPMLKNQKVFQFSSVPV